VGDALAIVVAERQGFSDKILVQTHPGGDIGREVSALGSTDPVAR
jgi:hypothetical protein